MLTESQKRLINDHGFIVLPDLFEVSEMQKLDADLIAYESRRAAQRRGEVLFSQKIAERDPSIRSFAKRREFVALSTCLLGPDTDLYFNQMVYKHPHGEKEFSWHQDDAYGPVEPSPYLTVWLAITDATPENGCISVMPGSHKQGLVPHWESSFGLACRSNADPDQGILVPVTAGSAVCFWSTLMHKSGANLTDETRKAFVLQFCAPGLRHKATGLKIKSRIAIARGGETAADESAAV
ncbi:MAG: hypothetical protein HONBIEJF_01822 [Fimbriimonadaceae bacterium]|nr:hypothetical protein [Fimbriimonadaceae bacterium]